MVNQLGIRTLSLVIGATLVVPGALTNAQQQAATASTVVATGPSVNDVAPDFSLAGADRYGLLKTPVKLSDYRGRTVVLAFFFKARTKG